MYIIQSKTQNILLCLLAGILKLIGVVRQNKFFTLRQIKNSA